jgi:Uma2 family endonuclease
MTVEEFLALPDDGIHRDMIRGVIKKREEAVHNRFHAETTAIVSHRLRNWLETLPPHRGNIFAGEVGCILQRSPDTIVGVDVAYFSEQTLRHQSDRNMLIEGAPVLAVEVLSPSDTQEHIVAKVESYLNAGTELVWLVDPHFRTVTVYRADRTSEMFDHTRTLTAEPHLPGFSVAVEKFFG